MPKGYNSTCKPDIVVGCTPVLASADPSTVHHEAWLRAVGRCCIASLSPIVPFCSKGISGARVGRGKKKHMFDQPQHAVINLI